MDIHALPALNATLNGLAAILLVRGYFLIKAGRVQQHKKTMLAAFATSIVFLICYLVYHGARVYLGEGGSVKFQGTGLIRPVYFTILISHTVLAASVPILAIITLRRGLKNDRRRHVSIAHWTLPIWLYVSVTGVIVYLMLYHL
jgi:protein SCO1/2/putative membrane protein